MMHYRRIPRFLCSAERGHFRDKEKMCGSVFGMDEMTKMLNA